MLTIGGNDIGFESIIRNCVLRSGCQDTLIVTDDDPVKAQRCTAYVMSTLTTVHLPDQGDAQDCEDASVSYEAWVGGQIDGVGGRLRDAYVVADALRPNHTICDAEPHAVREVLWRTATGLIELLSPLAIQLLVHSSPLGLGTAYADDKGRIQQPVLVPRDLAPGRHLIVATGLDETGKPLARYGFIEVRRPVSGVVWTLWTVGRSPAGAVDPGRGLPAAPPPRSARRLRPPIDRAPIADTVVGVTDDALTSAEAAA